MKQLILMMILFAIIGCGNNSGQTGVDNDGIKVIDSNGGLADTLYQHDPSRTDSSKGEGRVDISKRDTFDKPAQ